MGNRDMIQLLLDNGALPNTVNGVSGSYTDFKCHNCLS